MKKAGLLRKVYLGVLAGLPLVLILLPKTYFDHGRVKCVSVMLFDKECIGCGITRAIQRLIHFDFAGAAQFNKLSFVVLPLLILLWWMEVRKTYRKINQPEININSATGN